MEGYKAIIEFATRELSAKEKVMLKDTGNSVSLDECTSEDAPFIIDISDYVLLGVHNERSENKDYSMCVVIDKAGTKYRTSSQSFINALADIYDEMADCGEEWQLSVYRKESKNYKGKSFITCSVI